MGLGGTGAWRHLHNTGAHHFPRQSVFVSGTWKGCQKVAAICELSLLFCSRTSRAFHHSPKAAIHGFPNDFGKQDARILSTQLDHLALRKPSVPSTFHSFWLEGVFNDFGVGHLEMQLDSGVGKHAPGRRRGAQGSLSALALDWQLDPCTAGQSQPLSPSMTRMLSSSVFDLSIRSALLSYCSSLESLPPLKNNDPVILPKRACYEWHCYPRLPGLLDSWSREIHEGLFKVGIGVIGYKEETPDAFPYLVVPLEASSSSPVRTQPLAVGTRGALGSIRSNYCQLILMRRASRPSFRAVHAVKPHQWCSNMDGFFGAPGSQAKAHSETPKFSNIPTEAASLDVSSEPHHMDDKLQVRHFTLLENSRLSTRRNKPRGSGQRVVRWACQCTPIFRHKRPLGSPDHAQS